MRELKAYGVRLWQKIYLNDSWISLFVAVLIIGLVLFIGWDNNKLIPPFPKARFHYQSSSPLSFMSNWDGPNYLWIARHGYTSSFYASFFPLYPLLIKAFYFIFRSYLYAGLILSWVFFAGAIFYFIKILRHLGILAIKQSGLSAASFLVLFPTAVFFVATYTESLFALIALAAVYLTLKKRYWLLPPLMTLIDLTHITGILVVGLITLMLWEQHAKLRQLLSVIGGGLVGLVVFMVYLKVRFNSYLAFVNSQNHVHGWFTHSYLNLIAKLSVLNLVLIVLIILAAFYYWKNRRSFSIYCLLFLLIPIAGRQYGGFNRYVLMAFPVQFMLYEYLNRKKNALPYALVIMAIVWTYTVLQYAAGYIGS